MTSALRTGAAGLASAVLFALAGCVAVPVGAPAYGYQGAVAVAPPGPQVEVVGVAPAPGYFWVGGWWAWTGGHYAWRPGYWEAYRPGYHWIPHQWARGPSGWQERPGHWHPA